MKNNIATALLNTWHFIKYFLYICFVERRKYIEYKEYSSLFFHVKSGKFYKGKNKRISHSHSFMAWAVAYFSLGFTRACMIK
jgi:hypothetical protein